LVFTAVSAVCTCSLFTFGFFLMWLFFDMGERYIEENEHADSFTQLQNLNK
jgi:hypothetical protein